MCGPFLSNILAYIGQNVKQLFWQHLHSSIMRKYKSILKLPNNNVPRRNNFGQHLIRKASFYVIFSIFVVPFR